MTKIDRQVFVNAGAEGGATKGPSKRRGDAEYYRAIQKKAAETRKRNRKAKERK